MVKDGDVVKRNGNLFKVKRDKWGGYYTALLIGKARVTSWHKTSKRKILSDYVKVNDVDEEIRQQQNKLKLK